MKFGITCKERESKCGDCYIRNSSKKDFLNERRSEDNSRLRMSLPDSLEIISHNLTKDMLYDRKHIRKYSLFNKKYEKQIT